MRKKKHNTHYLRTIVSKRWSLSIISYGKKMEINMFGISGRVDFEGSRAVKETKLHMPTSSSVISSSLTLWDALTTVGRSHDCSDCTLLASTCETTQPPTPGQLAIQKEEQFFLAEPRSAPQSWRDHPTKKARLLLLLTTCESHVNPCSWTNQM